MTGVEDGLGAILNTPGGVAGSTATALVTIGYLLRRFFLSDKVASATAAGNVDVIQRLMEAADRSEKRAEAAELRADTAYKERNDAMTKIGELTEQVRALKQLVEELQRSINVQTHQ